MAPNSLFAILLRSHWSISFAIAFVLAGVCFALIPPQYAFFGALGALPFFGIGCFRLVRQFGQLNEEEVQKVLQAAGSLNQQAFGDVLLAAFARKGYQVQRAQADPAVDLLLTKAGQTTLVACRRWKAANHGVEPLRSLVQARTQRDASHCVYVAIAEVQAKTQRFATDNGVELLAGADLAALLGREVLRRGA